MKIVIIGGVAGGATAAARLRRLNEENEIIMFEKGKYISFANCGLPYHIGDEIKERANLLVQTPKGMEERFNIDVRNETEIIKIDRENKKVVAKNLKEDKEYEETYDKLIIATGAKAFIPNIKGIKRDNIFKLKNIKDMDDINDFIRNKNPKKALVIGAGYIGIEIAENLKKVNLDVTVVEREDQILNTLDRELASIPKKRLEEKGIKVKVSSEVTEIKEKEVILKNEEKLECDFIVLSLGVRPNIKLAVDANLKIGDLKGITVDKYLKTNDKDIYAVGDVIETDNIITGKKTLSLLASPANRQARLVSDNIMGEKKEYKGVIGSSIIKIFDLTVGTVGLNEKMLKRYDIDYKVARVHPNSHAGYYPGAYKLTMKLLFTDKGKILGAQIIGKDGVDKRIDVIATAIKGNLNVSDLEELELSYAPPYSSAKDPVNMIGYVANNILKEELKVFEYDEIESIKKDNNAIILDIRTKEEVKISKIEGSINIPLKDLRNNLEKLDKNKTIYTYCQVGQRGYIAYKILQNNGFDVKNLNGGLKTLKEFKHDKAINREKSESEITVKEKVKIDACGLMCPGPIMQLKNCIEEINDGEIVKIEVTDTGFKSDVRTWCDKTGNKLIKIEENDEKITAYIVKGNHIIKENDNEVTMVLFNQELDKVLASFVIANGARAMGKDVTMFFTFWGLNAIRKKAKVKKSFLDKMFSIMMPTGTKKLPISNMNFSGIGPKLIRKVMKDKNVDSLEEMIKKAKESGVNMVACSMSMDVMGIKKEELVDDVEIGGVATFLGKSENLNLFI